MQTTNPTVENRTDRRIESGRLHKALSQDMEVAANAEDSLKYVVTHDGTTYHDVDVETGTCECEDYQYRGQKYLCKHLLRASITHAFRSEPNTEIVARVLARVHEVGCIHDVDGCAGPTEFGPRGIPCEGCIQATPGHWTMWCRLSGEDDRLDISEELTTVEPEPVLVTDGGRELTGDHPLDVRCNQCDAEYRIDETIPNDCPECGFIDFDVVDSDPEIATDGGTVDLVTTHDAGGPGRPERRPMVTDGSVVTETTDDDIESGINELVRENGEHVVHQAGDWTLSVTAKGIVRTYGTAEPYGRTPRFTTRSKFWAPKGRDYAYGLTIENVLSRYAHETRHARDPNYAHGAALRRGIIEALCEIAPEAYPDTTTGDAPPAGVIHVNAPTGSWTTVVAEDTTTKSDYATFYPFDDFEGTENPRGDE